MSVAIVTGGSSGIGQSASIQIARNGVGVILTYDKNKTGAIETVAEIEKQGGKAIALPLEVGKSDTFPEFRDAVTKALADIWQTNTFTYLVNNAGFGRMSLFEDTSEELFDEFMRVLLKGPYFLTQILLPILEDGGAILNTTSNAALSSGLEEGFSAYATMKGGLMVLTRYMAKEFSKRGIRVNSIAPGATRTRLSDNAFGRFPELAEPLAAKTALGRLGEPDDIGKAIAALLSDDCRWITAENIEVSGGFNL